MRRVWRDVIAALSLPECPQDLSEPQYTSLAFEPLCSVREPSPLIARVDDVVFLAMSKYGGKRYLLGLASSRMQGVLG
jgi:hypothetical protein